MLPRTFARIGFSVFAVVVVSLSVVASTFAQSSTPAKSLPTVVLVHGAWADGTGWQGSSHC